MKYNKLLADEDRKYYEKLIEKMFSLCPEMMSRKISRANVQQAFILDAINKEIELLHRPSILCVGSYEDTASEFLKKSGVVVTDIDPNLNTDLHGFISNNTKLFNIVFSTSVLEHVDDDEKFIKDFCSLLSPGGLGILTCDFNNNYKPGHKLPYSDLRFYTANDLENRLGKIVLDNGCKFVDVPNWSGEPDFTHDECSYSFASMVFRKD